MGLFHSTLKPMFKMSETSIYSTRGLGSFALCKLVNCIFDCFYLHWFIVYLLQLFVWALLWSQPSRPPPALTWKPGWSKQLLSSFSPNLLFANILYFEPKIWAHFASPGMNPLFSARKTKYCILCVCILYGNVRSAVHNTVCKSFTNSWCRYLFYLSKTRKIM